MSWQDRIKPASYTSPSGKTFTFLYEDLEVNITKNGTEWNFPDVKGTYIQSLGNTGRRYPFNFIFSGEDNDTESEEFVNALLEDGIATFSHPTEGVKEVVALGDIRKSIRLKTAANETIITTTLFDTIGLIYPVAQIDEQGSVKGSIGSFNDQLSEDFGNNINFANEAERVSFRNTYSNILDNTKSFFDNVTQAEKSVNDTFNDIYNSIDNSIDILIAEPATLAFQTAILLQTPALLTQSLTDRIDGYKNLIDGLIGGDDSIKEPSITNISNNEFYNDDLFVVTSISGYIDSAVNWEFETRNEAILLANDILETFDSITEWRDNNIESLGVIDLGGEFQELQQLVSLAAGFLVQTAFSLNAERTIILDRNRSIIDLAAELYGEVDEKLDFLINSNDLSGSEILELPKGKEIKYFV